MAAPDTQPSSAASLNAARERILRAETIGLLLIAIIILMVLIARNHAYINWSAR